jgi:hypothetical protein
MIIVYLQHILCANKIIIMLSSISWENFLSFIAVIFFIWYVTIGIIFYPREIRQFLKSPFEKRDAATGAEKINQDQHQDLFIETQNLRDELSILMTGVGDKLNREELITGLQLKLKFREKLKGTAFQVAVNNYIISEAENKCSIRFTDQELDRLWVK